MGLFDKKFCDICGDKIGLLGNKKLADANMCKNCARKLSPFCDDRRQSTLEQIKAHLQYREENKVALRSFSPNLTLGEYKKFYIDTMNRTFVVSSNSPSNWDEENPDVIPMSQITSCGLDIDEHKRELYTNGKDGQRVSYNPPRYDYDYDFDLVFRLNNPYFDDFTIRLNRTTVEQQGSMEYNRYQQMAMEIMNAIGVGGNMPMNGMPMNNGMGMNNMGMNGMPMNNGMGMNGMPMNNNMGGFVRQQNVQQNPYGQPNMYGQPQQNMQYGQQNMYGQPQQNMQYGQPNQYGQPQQGYQQNNGFNQQPMQSPATSWVCPSCNATNDGAFCECCGTKRM